MHHKTVAKLFEDTPCQWGLRGDPYLWDEMRNHFAETPFPKSEQELESLLAEAFFVLTGQTITTENNFRIERLAHGGMSSGWICPSFWQRGATDFLKRAFQRESISPLE